MWLVRALQKVFITQRMATSLKRVAAFSNVQQRSKISIIDFTFILILFLPCLFWCYPLFQYVYKSSTTFIYFCLSVLLYILSSCQYIHSCCLRHKDVRCEHWEVFEKFLLTKFFSAKFQTFSFQVFTFQAILPEILI